MEVLAKTSVEISKHEDNSKELNELKNEVIELHERIEELNLR